MKFENLTGQTFGKLTVIEKYGKRNKATLWKCKCECGNETIVLSGHLKDGHTQSCGCIQRYKARETLSTHGLSKHPLYKVYRGIVDRTTLESCKCYKNYGGRGIKLCDEWANDFKAFYDWSIANGYSKGLTIDRIDVNGDYSPNNCRWITMKAQQNNRRNNRILVVNGESHTMKEWSEIRNINYTTLSMRINKLNWSIEEALEF